MEYITTIKLEINLTLNEGTAQEKIIGLIIMKEDCSYVIFSIHFLLAFPSSVKFQNTWKLIPLVHFTPQK